MSADGFLIKHLIFDFDGTLFFTKKANYEAYRQAFSEVEIVLTEVQYDHVYGLRADDLFTQIAPLLSADQIQYVRESKAKYYKKLIHLIEPNVELINFMKLMKNTHQMALVTTASKVNVLPILEHYGLSNFFNVTVFGDDVSVGKPNPECYLICLGKIGAEPQECLVFEDSTVGIRAAQLAHLNVIKVDMPVPSNAPRTYPVFLHGN